MGSEAFDRDQLRLAWAAIGAGALWLIYYSFGVPGRFATMAGSTRRLIIEHTEYATYMGYAYGEHALVMWTLTLLPVALAAWWCYRGRQDDWEFLYE